MSVDLGGTKIAAALVLPDGRRIAARREPTRRQGFKAVLDQMEGLIRAVLQESGAAAEGIQGIAVACPGPVDAAAGLVVNPPNLPGWRSEPLHDRLRERLGLPVRIANDGDCAALAEWRYGAGRGCRHLLYVTVSTGVGGGLILNGRLWSGSGSAGEIGHIPVNPEGPPCGCGRRGCLEAYSSGTAIARAYRSLIAPGDTASLPETPLRAEHVFAAARQGNETALRVVNDAASILGRTLGGVVNVLAVERIILGGGVGLGESDLLLPPILHELEESVFPLPLARLSVRLAELRGESALIGAASLFHED